MQRESATVETVRRLPTMKPPELAKLWEENFGKPPHKHLRPELMRLVLAFRIQARAYGGHSPDTARRLQQIVKSLNPNSRAHDEAHNRYKPGTRILDTIEVVSNSVSILTKPGQLREGFRYQDLYGMHMAITWLEQPSNMTWMRLEADDFGFLDDVAVLRSDGTLCLNQIKHVTERPERPGLSVDDLLEKDGKKSRSLFQKWFQSWLSVEADPAYIRVEVIVHANRPPAENLAALFCKNPPLKIDPALLRSENPTAFASFLEQAGDDAVRLDDFLNTVAFRLNSPDIEPTEEALKERAKFLNIGDEGFRALSDKIYEWSTRKGEDRKTVRITLDAVKQACGWRKGERLSEEFPVAPDYIPLGGYALQAFTNKVLSYDAGEFLLSDVPGAGKSTFLTKLYSHLDANGVSCVRHHYFLSGDDDAKYPRLIANAILDCSKRGD